MTRNRSSPGSRPWISVRPNWCVVCGFLRPTAPETVAGGVDVFDDDPVADRLADRLAELGVDRVVMEATSDYWKPVFYLLEAPGFEVWLVNARDVKHLPGRPKTDGLDAVWLCKVAERQMLRPSFVPPPPIRRLRDLTRYRVDLVGERTAEKNRVEKLLEDAQIKLSVVASDIFGVSGRAMMAALIAGRTRPEGAGAAGAVTDAQQDQPAGGGVHRPLQRPPRVPAGRGCCPASTRSTPTSPPSTTRSRSIWPLSPRRWRAWMRSPASGRSPPRSSSPRSAST